MHWPQLQLTTRNWTLVADTARKADKFCQQRGTLDEDGGHESEVSAKNKFSQAPAYTTNWERIFSLSYKA